MLALELVQQAMMRAIALGPDHMLDNLFTRGRARSLWGLAVHANTISHARLVALEDTFPRTRQLLGEAAFNVLSRSFLEAGAGSLPLVQIGRDFPEWLATRNQAAGAIDLARFEWAWLQCYHAAEAVALSLPELARLGPEGIARLVLTRHPASAALDLHTDARSLIEAETGTPLPFPCVLLARPEAEVRTASATPAMVRLYDTFGVPLPVCNLLAQSPEPAMQEALLALVAAGALIRAEGGNFSC